MTFFLSKFLWIFINPFSIFFFFLFISILLLLFRYKKSSTYILIINFIFISIIAIFPIGKVTIQLLERNYYGEINYPQNIDGILILAGATNPYLSNEYDSINLNSSAERLIESVFLIKKYKNANVIFSGGSGSLSNSDLSHAKVAKKFFSKMELDIENIIFEDQSRNTYENILFSKKIAKPKKNQNWLLVTSAAHMHRSILICEKNNWKVIPYPVDFTQVKKISFYPNLNFLGNVNAFQQSFHEWLGLISYYFMGRTSKIF